ncbi:MAG: hypothetical protein ACREDR_00865 [Blastocatellia bacterium]
MSKKLTQLKAVYWVYIAILGGYILYSYATKSGLYALLIDEQLKLFGKAEVELAIFIPFIVLMLPVAGLASYVRRQERLEQLRDPKTAAALAAGLRGPAVKPEKPAYWLWIGGAALLPFLISLGAYFYMTAVDAADQSRSIYHMDLAKSSDLPGADVKFLEIAGVFQKDSEYNLVEDTSGMKSRDAYGPLTDPNWTPAQPVQYFLYLKSQGEQGIAIGHYNQQKGRFEVMPPSGPFNSTFGGQLSRNSLPEYVKSAFGRRGIRATDPYYVVEWMGDLNGPVSSKYNGQMYYLIPVLGAFFSFVVLAGGAIAFVNRKRQRQRTGL